MTALHSASWPVTPAVLVRGHRTASGQNGDPRFPGGTLAMQRPHFGAQGIDLGPFFTGTLNLSIAPHRYEVIQPYRTVRGLKWHPTEPAEDFSFFEARVARSQGVWHEALVYYPHPETKPEHHQPVDVLEVLAPYVGSVAYGDRVWLSVHPEQLIIHKKTPPC